MQGWLSSTDAKTSLVPDKSIASGKKVAVHVAKLVEGEEFGLERLSVCTGNAHNHSCENDEEECPLQDNQDNTLNLGLIGNCTIAAFINRKGAIVFCCLPQFDSDPMFSHLLSGTDFVNGHGFWDIYLRNQLFSNRFSSLILYQMDSLIVIRIICGILQFLSPLSLTIKDPVCRSRFASELPQIPDTADLVKFAGFRSSL
jgi:hypothetical protein